MDKIIKIKPDIEQLKEISPFAWLEDETEISFSKIGYDKIQEIINKCNINIKTDNACYIYKLLKEEMQNNHITETIKTKKEIYDSDRQEFKKLLELLNSQKRIQIDSMKFTFNVKKKEKFTNGKLKRIDDKERIEIKDPEVINECIKILNNNYNFDLLQSENFSRIIKKQNDANKPNVIIKKLANSIFKYLSSNNTENNKYYFIGLIFNLVGFEPDLSEENYKSQEHSYPTYKKFIVSRIRNKYFKG